MATIAIYNMKGGVGKTTMSVNLAWCSAAKSGRSTLLWDLDPQGASTYIIGEGAQSKDEAHAIFSQKVKPKDLIQDSSIEGVKLIAADRSLRGLDRYFFGLNKKKRLKKILSSLEGKFERVILDCAPGLTETSEQILRAADLIIVPIIPSTLSWRALEEVQHFVNTDKGKHAPLLPVYSMVDRRRTLHLQALDLQPKWPAIPMASSAERMAERREPLGITDPNSTVMQAYAKLWTGIERRLAKID